MPEINEWTFAADVCKWIAGILADNPGLPFSEAKVEQPSGAGRKRRDLTLYNRTGEPVLTGEIKLPDRPDGQSPYSDALRDDAFEKANQKGVEYFFTWNVNRFVLWKTFEARKSVAERDLEHFNVTSITNRDHLSSPGVQAEIRGMLSTILGRFARILEGTEPIRSRPLDEKFIRVLESALELPILQTKVALSHRYAADKKFARDLNAWMRDSQGWVLSTDPRILEDNIERAAKFSCYVLVNKIVFRQALQRRFPTLRKIRVPESLKSAAKLQELFRTAFEEAKRVSHDYETVFDGDVVGDTLPFQEDATVVSWREFLREIEGFDFGKIEYDIIGQIFERLISPEERHRYGQHYTRSEIVDLINAFTIRDSQAIVLDPACGGGTFLVRAYVLKRELSGGTLPHADLLQQIKGIDISAWAAHLATINLATRDLIDERNYPLVARSDFFDVRKDKAIFLVPLSVHGKGKQMVSLAIEEVDAVVGNPPYVKQEEIGSAEYKGRLRELVRKDFLDARLSGRSDLHCYFWPHATSFLREGGYYGFLTSSAWLDTEYGFHLQEWLLKRFAILALFESNCEPWFTGARVTTVATLLRRESDPLKRANNAIRFVQLRKPLKEVLESFDSDPLKAARLLRDFVENLHENWADDRWCIRVVNQHKLWKIGCTGGVAMSFDASDAQKDGALFQGSYTAGKWGIYLRAPDVFFKILDRCGSRLVPLGQLAEIRFGVKSGADDFFFVRDVTDEEIKKAAGNLLPGSPQIARRFREKWGVRLADTKRVRVVQSGDGSRHMIEAECLEPEVHSLMEIDSVEIDLTKLGRKILLVSELPEKLRGTHVLKYIKWGEKEGFDQGATCSARAKTRPWYDLTVERRSPILWPKAHQYRHIIPINEKRLIPNCRMYDLFVHSGIRAEILAGVLNSTLVALLKFLYGRPVGREGSLDTEVVDVNMMLVPDVRGASPNVTKKINQALGEMRKRLSNPLLEEFGLRDRRSLDDATLELLGISDSFQRKELQSEIYSQVEVLYREIREVELRKQVERRITARRDRASPRTLAEEIWGEFDKAQIRAFPSDFVPSSEPTETIELPAGKAKVLDDLFDHGALQINGSVIRLGSKLRAEFAAKVVELGNYGPTPVPTSDYACKKALQQYQNYEARMEATFRELAEERSADPEIQSRIVRELCKLLYASARQP